LQVPPVVRAGRRLDHRFESAAKFAHKAHVLALEPEAGRVHFDELSYKDSRARVVLVLISLRVRHGGTNEIIHKLKLTTDRNAESGKLSLFGRGRFGSELRHPDCVPQPKAGRHVRSQRPCRVLVSVQLSLSRRRYRSCDSVQRQQMAPAPYTLIVWVANRKRKAGSELQGLTPLTMSCHPYRGSGLSPRVRSKRPKRKTEDTKPRRGDST
jgi:hypothetical protein